LGHVAAFSFYPTKNLGAMGDGGAVVTGSTEVAERLRLLRQYGWRDRYVSDAPGYNSRLDELQAAILRVKLRHLETGNAARRQVAGQYRQWLADLPLLLPHAQAAGEHVYHLFVIQLRQRDALRAYLQEQGIGTAVHYPVPVHRQPAYYRLGYEAGSLPITERVAGSILSLPMHAYLSAAQVEAVAAGLKAFFTAKLESP
jgi:dTDP-4-amino-4,6-dideoxygalactose transaminase